ncbi:MAG: glycosyltransferase family 2 protein [Pseudomonadota bacterium]
MNAARPRQGPPVSVAILSHRRPNLLRRVITALSQLDYTNFEIVVVGDQPSVDDYGLSPDHAAAIRYVAFSDPNICKARNLAIEASGGDIIAFCDDDAVPEPDWLRRLVAPFADPSVATVAGAVRGRDGLTLEWAGGWFDRTGRETCANLSVDGVPVSAEQQNTKDRFLSLIGTNIAFRRDAIVQIGGFDQAIRYFLDETDVALRLAEAGWSAVFAARAEVHHLREQNDARSALRVPRNLFEIAASKAYFCARHLPAGQIDEALARFTKDKRAELDPYLRLGVLRSAQLGDLMNQIENGLKDGMERQADLPLSGRECPPFTPFPARTDRLSIALRTGWGPVAIRQARRFARALSAAGHTVSCFSYFSGFHGPKIAFSNGIWLHGGGTWRLDRFNGRLPVLRRAARAAADIARINGRRRFDLVLEPAANGHRAGDVWVPPGGTFSLRAQAMPAAGREQADLIRLLEDSLTNSNPIHAEKRPESGE